MGDGFEPLADDGFQPITAPVKRKAERYPHAWDPAALRKSSAAQNAAAGASFAADDENMPIEDRLAHLLLGGAASVPGSSLADEAAGVGNASRAAIEAGPRALLNALGVDVGGPENPIDAYRSGRAGQREAEAMAQDDPLYNLGIAGGTVAQIPVGMASGAGNLASKGVVAGLKAGAKAGAVGGGMQGFGEGEGLTDSLKRAGKGAAIGAATGGALGALGGARGGATDVAMTNFTRRAAAAVTRAAAKAAPVAGRVVGGVKGAAVAGPIGAAGGWATGAKAGDWLGELLGKAAGKIGPRLEATPDMVVGSEAAPPPIPYDILDAFGIAPEPTIKATPVSPSTKTPADVIDAEYEVMHPSPPSSAPPMRMLPPGNPIDYTGQAEAFDPAGADWNAWRNETPAAASARPDLDAAFKVMTTGTKVDRTPTPKTPPPDLHAGAVDDLIEQEIAGPSTVAPDVAAEGAKLDQGFANAVADGNMSPRQAVGASRAAARKAAAPTSGPQMRAMVRELLTSEPKLASKPSVVAKRLGISVADARREIGNVQWGR